MLQGRPGLRRALHGAFLPPLAGGPPRSARWRGLGCASPCRGCRRSRRRLLRSGSPSPGSARLRRRLLLFLALIYTRARAHACTRMLIVRRISICLVEQRNGTVAGVGHEQLCMTGWSQCQHGYVRGLVAGDSLALSLLFGPLQRSPHGFVVRRSIQRHADISPRPPAMRTAPCCPLQVANGSHASFRKPVMRGRIECVGAAAAATRRASQRQPMPPDGPVTSSGMPSVACECRYLTKIAGCSWMRRCSVIIPDRLRSNQRAQGARAEHRVSPPSQTQRPAAQLPSLMTAASSSRADSAWTGAL